MDAKQPGDCSNDDLLVSWKDVAAYLKCSVRTAQRFESRGLPVNRIAGTKSVWASKSEIDRWFRSEAEKTKVSTDRKDVLSGRWFRPLFAIAAALAIGAAAASAYALTIMFFGAAAVLLMVARPALTTSAYMRAIAGLFVIAGSAYCVTATTLPDMVGSILNMTTLRPAFAYPFVAGLRFIPVLLLIALFLVVFRDDKGFALNRRSRTAYLFLGTLFLLAAAGISFKVSGVHYIWQAGLPIRWTLFAGELFVFGVNVRLFRLGYQFFNTTSIAGYDPFFKQCATGYLLIALTAAILGRHSNEIIKHHLDARMPDVYRAQSADPARDIRDWLQEHGAQAGPDLMSLSGDAEFLQALRTRDFYKYDFDEAFQAGKKAVIFGYKSALHSLDKQPVFVLVRFPADLAAVLRFESVH